MPLDFLPRRFVGIGGLLRQGMYPSMNIGVVPLIIINNDIDYLLRCLRGSCIVQIHQRLPIDLSLEDGKILSNGLYVQSGLYHCNVIVKKFVLQVKTHAYTQFISNDLIDS